jgi:hypothetical protein
MTLWVDRVESKAIGRHGGLSYAAFALMTYGPSTRAVDTPKLGCGLSH